MKITGRHPIDALLKQMFGERHQTCISVILSTHRLIPDDRTDRLKMEWELQRVKELLPYRYPKAEVENLIHLIDELYSRTDLRQKQDGLGFFVSRGLQELISFPFPVTEKIIVGKNFAIRDVLLKALYSENYLLVFGSGSEIRFYQGCLSDLEEIKGKGLPCPASEVTPQPWVAGRKLVLPAGQEPVAGGQVQLAEPGAEADPAVTEIYPLVAACLQEAMPLVLVGDRDLLNGFQKLPLSQGYIAGSIVCHNAGYTESELAGLAWPLVRTYLKEKEQARICRLMEAVNSGQAQCGMEKVWEAAQSVQGLKLLVEKDFRMRAFIGEHPAFLYQRPPFGWHEELDDAVDIVIELVLENKGQVFFTSNGLLENYGRIALVP